MQVICPYCGSSRTTTKNHGRKTGSAIGTVAAPPGRYSSASASPTAHREAETAKAHRG